LVAGELAHEVLGAALGDRAEVVDRLLPRQADAPIGDGQRAGRLVEADAEASDELEISSRRKISLFEYKACVTR
jgi:hypothetical protein